MRTSDFDYNLPPELIAQTPLERRDESRLMVVHRPTGAIAHRRFRDVVDFLERGDCVVLNDTRVMRARLFGNRERTGGRVEILLLREVEPGLWEVLARPARRVRPGDTLLFGGGRLKGTVVEDLGESRRRVLFEAAGRVPSEARGPEPGSPYSKAMRREGGCPEEGPGPSEPEAGRSAHGLSRGRLERIIEEIGMVPLPPYIKRPLPRGLEERYQTVYARREGSAAAPTAGLHFTGEMLDSLRERGVQLAFLTLHIGLGTFRPVKSERVEEHRMHEEFYEIPGETAAAINEARSGGRKVIAVGTTSVRAVEASATPEGFVSAGAGSTDLFIYPGYRFKVTDGLLTNFHLPRSTLLMLVCAFAGRELVLRAYEEAVRERYRFYSFGDAMLIL